jgi:branched-chain amino acid transport system permease protein
MTFLIALVVDGALAGAVYALVGLAFVVVYKASRMINFSLGEWLTLGSRLVATGVHLSGLGLLGALGFGCAGMVLLAWTFNAIVLRRLLGQPVIALIMVTIGLGALMRGSAAMVFARVPTRIALPIPTEPLSIHGVLVATDKLVAAALAALAIVVVSVFFQRSRTGMALRAIADDQYGALAMGIDIQRYFAITWGLMGALAVLAGTLWTVVSGGGFGVVLLGLKVFPVVILGGLDSVVGTILGAVTIGVLESVAVGYLDPLLGAGFSTVASYLVLLGVLIARPYGLCGRPDVERV